MIASPRRRSGRRRRRACVVQSSAAATTSAAAARSIRARFNCARVPERTCMSHAYNHSRE
eukprot:5820274-Prymnesium_polylepis.2